MITTRKLRVVYRPPGIEAVKDVSIEIPEKTVTCIIGPNASGKTSILKAVASLVEYEGGVYIDGREARETVKLLRKILSYAHGLNTATDYLGARVLDVLLFSRYPISSGFADSRLDYEEVYRVSELLGIEHLLHRRLSELSSGELQRVVLAAALAKDPRIVLLDEPDNHLDPAHKVWLSELLKELSKSKTVVITTHDTVFASSTCDYVVVVSGGRVIYTGFIDGLVENPEHLEKAYGVNFSVLLTNSRKILVPVYDIKK